MRRRVSVLALRLVAVCALFVAAVAIGQFDVLRGVERVLQNASFAARDRAASGQVHIVEIDADSIAAVQRWPWPRSHYGRIVDRLNQAGVRSIVFDVDFSAPSTRSEDAAFAAALARSRARVVLPTFAQQASFGSDKRLESAPIAALRKHAVLGSVSVLPDRDGLVRKMPLGTVTGGLPRPTLSAQIAQRSGAAWQAFPIDYAIDPATIPRHSFAAVEGGRFDARALVGKDVLIGATAIELFDRYATPRHGVLPGVVVQALASETLYRGVPRDGGFMPLLLLATLPALLVLGAKGRGALAVRTIGGIALLLSAGVMLMTWLQVSLEAAPALFLLGTATAVRAVLLLRRRLVAWAAIDSESGLPNSRAYAARGDEPSAYTIAAMIGDFDALRSVVGNERIGDLIVRIADRLRTAGCGPVIYRPDDRVLVWDNDATHFELEALLADLKAVMRLPVEIGGSRVDIAVFFGVAHGGALTDATLAASVAQNRGAAWHYHQATEALAIAQQTSLMGELDAAIAGGDLRVLYQPKLHLPSSRVTSVEALVRWEHPTRGMLSPDLFIPLAERNDRIADLTLYVLRQTIADLKAWCQSDLVFRAAVNISARLITSTDFAATVERVIRETGVPTNRLIFEVTESATMSDPDTAVAVLERFAAMGIGISMDDYGTGQSSLTYLRTLPLSELKIDRSFVAQAHTDRNDALLVRSTIELSHSLGLEVVAEGVEDEACLAFLRAAKCDYAQGYLIGKPMTSEAVTALVSEPNAEAA